MANDLKLRGPGTATIVTGSNMAGKSTGSLRIARVLALHVGDELEASSQRAPPLELARGRPKDDAV
ncbi:MAG: hypothetical protein K8H88_05420, partial [Sandaracinaceae bacterium]|nr:hypothetical protein [Sandaracinaceae bacterium]